MVGTLSSTRRTVADKEIKPLSAFPKARYQPNSTLLAQQSQMLARRVVGLKEQTILEQRCQEVQELLEERARKLIQDYQQGAIDLKTFKQHKKELLASAAVIGFSLLILTNFNPKIQVRDRTLQSFSPTPKTEIVNTSSTTQAKVRLSSVKGQDLKVTSLMHAIIGQESAGKFDITNPHSGALGYGQVMPENVPSWSQEALGYSLTPKKFLASPDLQIKIIKHQLQKAFDAQNQLGRSEEEVVRRVAAIWYSGQSKLWNNEKPQYYDGHPYPSIAEYTRSVWDKYQHEIAKAQAKLSPQLPVPVSAPVAFPKPQGLLSYFFGIQQSKAASVQQSQAQKIVNYMEKQGYEITRNSQEVNIIHVRNGDNARNKFEDKRIVLKFDASGVPQIVGEWAETAKPGLSIVRNPFKREGAFFISEGQYKAWQVGIHYGQTGRHAHEALIQVAPISGRRDSDRNTIPDTPVRGNFDVNIHAPWSDGGLVDDRSAGCLVTKTKAAHEEFMAIVKSDRRHQQNPKFVFTATIIDRGKL
jgi:hypothetical protein